MKILVISDSHDRRDLVKKCIMQNSQAEVVIHLGDCVSDTDGLRFSFPDRMFVNVRGNNDFEPDVPISQIITLEGVKLFITHGHRYGVNYGLESLISSACNENAQICLYGHTHTPYNKYHNGLYVMNPGSLAYPREVRYASFGLIELCPQGIMTNIVKFKSF